MTTFVERVEEFRRGHETMNATQTNGGETDMTKTERVVMADRVRTYKIQVTPAGVTIVLNGKAYELGQSMESFSFDLQRAVAGYAGIYESDES
jgi:hypothetical protein